MWVSVLCFAAVSQDDREFDLVVVAEELERACQNCCGWWKKASKDDCYWLDSVAE